MLQLEKKITTINFGRQILRKIDLPSIYTKIPADRTKEI